MRKFKNFIGCEMNFEDNISQAEINKRLSFFGSCNWIEINDKGEPIQNVE